MWDRYSVLLGRFVLWACLLGGAAAGVGRAAGLLPVATAPTACEVAAAESAFVQCAPAPLPRR